MNKPSPALSRRERQIMDVVYQQGRVTAAEVRDALPDAPGYSAVRALLRILEDKGHLTHTEDGKRYVYLPTQPRPLAARSALHRIVQTFFGGSVERTVATLLSSSDTKLSEEELARLSALIDQAKEGRPLVMPEHFAGRVMALLLDASLKSLLMLAVAGSALLCLRRASAAARHLVLLLTLLCLLLLPLLSSTLPGWSVRWPRAAGLPTVSQTVEPPAPKAFPPLAPPLISPDTLPADAVTRLPAVPDAPRSLRLPWPLLGCGLWLVGVCTALIRVMAGLVCVHRLGRKSLPVTASAVTQLSAELAQQLGVGRSVTLRRASVDAAPPIPMTWGWRRPLLLLPRAAEEWPSDRLRVVLLHELAHIRRKDWLWQMLAHLTCALYWFHPGVWLVARALRAESERACDDQVLSAGIPAPDYARHLVEVARTLSRTGATAGMALPMATSQVQDRVFAILKTQRRRDEMTKRSVTAATVAAAALLLPLALLRPGSGAQTAPNTPQPPPNFTVVVDPGHGGQDTGAVGLDGTLEKDLDLSIAESLRDTLTKQGVRVIMTRTGDTYLPLTARSAFVRANGAQYLVSIHLTAKGFRLTSVQARELERQLAADPNDLTLRLEALGLYSRPGQHSATNSLRDAQILWLIRNHPDNALLGTPETLIPRKDAAAYAEAKRLWLAYTAAPSPSPKVLGRVASFLTLSDFPSAERLYLAAEAAEPGNPEWPDRLGHLYQLQELERGRMRPDYHLWARKALAQYERLPTSDPQASFNVDVLAETAKSAYDAEAYDTARACAQRLLRLPAIDGQSVAFRFFGAGGVAVHQGNMILGRLALRGGDSKQAQACLLAMGDVSGSGASTLVSFGPNMQLAQDLLKTGERQAVLQYFDECAKFWHNDYGALDRWRGQIKRGQMPDFGGNLVY